MEIHERQHDIKMKGVKVANDALLPVNPHLPRNVFYSIFCGTAGSGKTSTAINLLTKYYKGVFDKIFVFSGSPHTLPDSFVKKISPKRFLTEITPGALQQIGEEAKENQESTLILIDDMIVDIARDKELKNVLKRMIFNRRHMRCYIILITQRFREIPFNIRSMADSIFFWNFNNKKETEALFEDFINDFTKKEYYDLIKYMISNNSSGHDFLYINVPRNKYYRNFNELIFKTDDDSENDSSDIKK